MTEIVRRDDTDVVEGVVVVDDMPYATAEEAHDAILRGVMQMKDGVQLLDEARQRGAHTTLGKPWEDCLMAVSREYESPRLSVESRQGLVVTLKQQQLSTRAIGAVLNVSAATVHRDIQDRTKAGDLPEEDDAQVVSKDGRTRPAKQEPRRAPLPKTFTRKMDELRRASESVAAVRKDDRWNNHVGDFSIGWKADLEGWLNSLSDVLEDFVRAQEGKEE